MSDLNELTPNENPAIADLPLWKSFVVGLFGSMFFAFILRIMLDYSRGAAWLNFSEYTTTIVWWVFFMPFYLVVMASLWKCAYNTNIKFLGHLARIYAVLSTGLIGAICITQLFFE